MNDDPNFNYVSPRQLLILLIIDNEKGIFDKETKWISSQLNFNVKDKGSLRTRKQIRKLKKKGFIETKIIPDNNRQTGFRREVTLTDKAKNYLANNTMEVAA